MQKALVKMSNFSRRHFGDVDITELIRFYKQYECLWNFNSPSYKSKPLKHEAWAEIANYFQKDLNDLKRKIKYLRSAYVGEKRKVEIYKKSGKDYKPILFYYKDLDFLGDYVVWRNKPGEFKFENVDISTNAEDEDEEEEIIPFEPKEESVEPQKSQISCKSETFNETEIETIHSPPPCKTTPKISFPRSLGSRPTKRKMSDDVKLNKSVVIHKPSSPISNNLQCRNLYISFGKTVALQLQQLPLDVAILTMSEIHTILTKKSLEHIKSLQNCQDSSDLESEESYSEFIEEALNESS